MNITECVEAFKEMIRVGKSPCQNWEINNERMQYLLFAIEKLELLEKVEKSGVEKVDKSFCHCEYNTKFPHGIKRKCEICYFNEVIDLCNAHLVKKLEGIWDIIAKGLEGRNLIGGAKREEAATDIAQAIKNYMGE